MWPNVIDIIVMLLIVVTALAICCVGLLLIFCLKPQPHGTEVDDESSENGNEFADGDEYWSRNPDVGGFHYNEDLDAPLSDAEVADFDRTDL